MNGWTPWFVVGLVTLVTLVVPFIYRKTRAALLRRKGFVPLDDLLRRKRASSKEFWSQVEARGSKVRMRGRGETAFVNAEDAAVIFDSIPRPIPRGDRFAEQLQAIGLSAIAAAAVSEVVEGHEDRSEYQPPSLWNTVIASTEFWSVTKVTFHRNGLPTGPPSHEITFNPKGFASPQEIYLELRRVPEFGTPGTVVRFVDMLAWVRGAIGLAAPVAAWCKQQDWRAVQEQETAKALVEPLRESIPFETHEMCVRSLADALTCDTWISRFRVGCLLRTLSDDRDNPGWEGASMLNCNKNSPIGGIFVPAPEYRE